MFKGNYKNGKKTGSGLIQYKNGVKEEEYWEEDVIINASKVNKDLKLDLFTFAEAIRRVYKEYH